MRQLVVAILSSALIIYLVSGASTQKQQLRITLRVTLSIILSAIQAVLEIFVLQPYCITSRLHYTCQTLIRI